MPDAPTPAVSPREQAQQQLVDYLTSDPKWTAPYGVLPGLDQVKRGKVRTVTFGIARTLDAVAYIWSVNNITLDCRGPAAQRMPHSATSIPALIDLLKAV